MVGSRVGWSLAVGLLLLGGCSRAGSNSVVYLSRDGDVERISLGCVLVHAEPGDDAEPVALEPTEPRGFSEAVQTSEGAIDYAFFVDGVPMLEEHFDIEDLQEHELVRRTFENGEDSYEVVFWTTADCDAEAGSVPRPRR
jgi:hypothetical protein